MKRTIVAIVVGLMLGGVAVTGIHIVRVRKAESDAVRRAKVHAEYLAQREAYEKYADEKIHGLFLKAKTTFAMMHIGAAVIDVGYDTGQRPPADNAALVTWLTGNGAVFHDAVIIQDGRFVDTWGNDLVVMVSEGEVFQLGSAGPNGQWEGGEGDDIVRHGIDTSDWPDEP